MIRTVLALLVLFAPAMAQLPSPGLADIWRLRDHEAGQASSWDRGGANADHGHFQGALPDGGRLLARLRGRGRITRIWSADPKGILRLVDGDRLLYEGPFADVFDGRRAPFVGPLTMHAGGGFTSYVPVDFARELIATLHPAPDAPDIDCYYHLGWERYRSAAPVPAARAVSALLTGFAESNDDEHHVRIGRVLRRTAVVLDLEGPAILRELRLRLEDPSPEHLRGVRIDVTFDGAPHPAISAPLGDFFGLAFDRARVQTEAQCDVGSERAFRLPMPFRSRASVRLTMEDASLSPLRFDFRAVARKRDVLPDEQGWLHATYRQTTTTRGEPFLLLETAGRGHFVGCFCVFDSGGRGISFLEGDEHIVVDGQTAFRGTGTEDYFSGAWYFRTGPFTTRFFAVGKKDVDRGRIVATRLHTPDPIPFRTSFRFELEHAGGNDMPGCRYSALAFHYADTPKGSGLPLPPPLTRRYLPPGPRLTFDAPSLAGQLRVLPGREMELAGGAVAVHGPGPRRMIRLPEVPAGRYLVHVRSVRGQERTRASLDFGGEDHRCELAAGRELATSSFGPVTLPGGEPVLGVTVEDGELQLDSLRLEPWRDSLREWLVLGPFPSPDRSGFDTVFPPEREIDFDRPHEVLGDGTKTWHRFEGRPWANGYIDLNSWFRPNDRVVAYALTHIESERDQEARLLLGSDDGVKVWWNGELVLARKLVRGAAPDQEDLRVRLRRGRNTLLLKIEENEGWWGFFARIVR